jgi:redox-sensitive bicupin YhaK (pirin superfamily)
MIRIKKCPVARSKAEALYLDMRVNSGCALMLAPTQGERAIYCVDKAVAVGGGQVESGTMVVLYPKAATIAAPNGARFVVIGDEPVDGSHHVCWNFVSIRKERIEQAKNDWLAQKMGTVLGATAWIPPPG